MILYEIKFQKADARHELLLTPDGRRVEEEVVKGSPKCDEDEENEKEVSINKKPGAVKVTVLKHTAGGEVEKIECENEEGQAVYEVGVIIGDKKVELKADPNGNVLSKEVKDKDDEDDDEKDD
jgi:uncharacterized membrane protein YkoI